MKTTEMKEYIQVSALLSGRVMLLLTGTIACHLGETV